jgi:hypothetical protein
MNYLQGKKCMVWSFMGNARMYEALRDYGDRLDTVGIFTFEVDITGTITGQLCHNFAHPTLLPPSSF